MQPLRAQDPRQAGAYRLTARLGAGGMGEVFLGETADRGQVAVKFLKTEHAHDPEFRRRFAREVTAAQLVSGAHTAPVVDADPDGDPPWLATAYIPGPSLADAVGRGGPLSGEAVRRVGAGLAAGLSAIHARGLVHRDLKPANVILADDGPRIIDFGVARTMTATSLTATGMVIGTIGYMSPEQVGGAPVDTRSDVFSLGGILVYAATGREPFEAPSMPAVAARIVGGPPGLDGVTGPLRDIVEACLAKDPAARPGLDAIAAAFESGQTRTLLQATRIDHAERMGATAPAPTLAFAPDTDPGALPRRRKPGTPMIAAALIVVAAAGAAIALLASGGSAPQSPAARPTSAATAPAAPSTSAPAQPAAPAIPPGHAKKPGKQKPEKVKGHGHPGGHGGHGHGGHGD
ncbi:MAG: serine/threonine protein kinase [Streptosporangiales bacterium]|nr:serine/threonine protein kinase [Streptosporangiales bacterium]